MRKTHDRIRRETRAELMERCAREHNALDRRLMTEGMPAHRPDAAVDWLLEHDFPAVRKGDRVCSTYAGWSALKNNYSHAWCAVELLRTADRKPLPVELQDELWERLLLLLPADVRTPDNYRRLTVDGRQLWPST